MGGLVVASSEEFELGVSEQLTTADHPVQFADLLSINSEVPQLMCA